LKEQLDSNLTRLHDALRAVHEGFQYELKVCIPSKVTNATQFRLGMVVRLCDGAGGHACLLAGQTDETKVEKLIEWMRPAGVIVANRWAVVQDSGRLTIFNTEFPIELRPIEDRWPIEPEVKLLIGQFERYALAARKSHKKMSYVAPALMRLSIAQGSQVLDVTNAPGNVLAQLSPVHASFERISYDASPGAPLRGRYTALPWPKVEFAEWSDELARTRIKECATFRGTTEPARISECSGYQGGCAKANAMSGGSAVLACTW
jgi:hypothetical protein